MAVFNLTVSTASFAAWIPTAMPTRRRSFAGSLQEFGGAAEWCWQRWLRCCCAALGRCGLGVCRPGEYRTTLTAFLMFRTMCLGASLFGRSFRCHFAFAISSYRSSQEGLHLPGGSCGPKRLAAAPWHGCSENARFRNNSLHPLGARRGLAKWPRWPRWCGCSGVAACAALDHCVHTELQGRERTASLVPLPGIVMVQGQPPESGLRPHGCSSHRRSAFWFQSVSRLCHRGGIATSWFKLPECTCFTSFERFDFSCCLHFHSDIHSQVPFCLLALGFSFATKAPSSMCQVLRKLMFDLRQRFPRNPLQSVLMHVCFWSCAVLCFWTEAVVFHSKLAVRCFCTLNRAGRGCCAGYVWDLQ